MIGFIICATSATGGGAAVPVPGGGKGARVPCGGKGCGAGCAPAQGLGAPQAAGGGCPCPWPCACAPSPSGVADMLMTAFNCASSCALRRSNSLGSILALSL